MSRSFLNKKIVKQRDFFGGFGLIEMMVSIGILTLVMTVILARQDAFNSAVLLRGQAYEIALQAREIQMYAVSVTGEGTDFQKIYGIHFDTANGGIYNIFRDQNGDGNYDITPTDESFGKQGVLDSRFVIDAIRVGSNTLSEISITFERPNFDAVFPGAGNVAEIDVCVKGTACTTGDNNEVRTVEITRTGQISVK